MSEFKGTKGKWLYDKPIFHSENIERGITIWIRKGNFRSLVCNVRGSQMSEIEARSNALLISKAHEMLEMLNRFMEITRELNHPRLDHLRGSANKLIKEATEF